MPAERRRARQAGLPVLAMVDAFIGAISVILVLVLVVDPTEARPDLEPRAALVVACAEDRQSAEIARIDAENRRQPVAQGVAFDALPERLAREAAPEALSLRVVLEGPVAHARCMANIANLLALANGDHAGLGMFAPSSAALPVFITDEHLLVARDGTP